MTEEMKAPTPVSSLGRDDPIAYVCEADILALANQPDGTDMSIAPRPFPEFGMKFPLYAAPKPNSDLLEAAKKALNFITNTEGEMGITLASGDALRAALSATSQALPSQTSKWVPRTRIEAEGEDWPPMYIEVRDDMVFLLADSFGKPDPYKMLILPRKQFEQAIIFYQGGSNPPPAPKSEVLK